MTFPIDDFLIPFLTGRIINNVQNKKPWIVSLISLIIVLTLVQVFTAASSWHDALVIPSMQNFVRNEMVADLLKKFRFSNNDPVIGELMSRIIKIPLTLTYIYDQLKNYILVYIVSFTITALYIMAHDLILGIVVLISVFLVFVLVLFSPLTCMSATTKQDQTLSRVDEEIEDVLQNLKNVYVNDQVDPELARLKTFETKYEKAFLGTLHCTIKTRLVAIAILGIMLSVVAYRSYHGIKNKTMSPGTFVAIFIIISQWFGILGWMISIIREMTINWGIIDAFEKMAAKQNDIAEAENTPVHDSPILSHVPEHGVVFNNLSFKIGHKTIINQLTTYIPHGQRIALMGEIGSGKSTLLKLMLALLSPSSGEIYMEGAPLSKMSKQQLRQIICYSPQNPILFNRTIYENIVYGLKNVDRNYVMHLVHELGLEEAIDLDSLAGKSGSALSGGQKQLVSLMRVMLINPKIIVLDEITSSIDNVTKQKLFKILDKLFIGKTVIMVTHDSDMLKLANALYKMEGGKIHQVRQNNL